MNECYEILFFESLDSTNNYVRENVDKLDNRAIVLAKTQTHGRGRLERRWDSSFKDNLYFSLVLKDIKKSSHAQNITQVAALAIVETLKKYQIKALIKWPNDVLVNNKKISGILSETSIKGNELEFLILGIGININMSKNLLDEIDQPATSLSVELNRNQDNLLFLNSFLDVFYPYYDRLLHSGFEELVDEWKKNISLIGKDVRIKNLNSIFKARVLDINDDGTLKVELVNKDIKNISCGDIEV